MSIKRLKIIQNLNIEVMFVIMAEHYLLIWKYGSDTNTLKIYPNGKTTLKNIFKTFDPT